MEHHSIEAGDVGKAVVQRQENEHHVPAVNGDYGVALLDVGSVVPVGEEDALRVGCGARSVADVGVVVRADGGDALLELARMLLEELHAHFAQRLDGHLVFLKLNILEDNHLLHVRALRDSPSDLGKLLL